MWEHFGADFERTTWSCFPAFPNGLEACGRTDTQEGAWRVQIIFLDQPGSNTGCSNTICWRKPNGIPVLRGVMRLSVTIPRAALLRLRTSGAPGPGALTLKPLDVAGESGRLGSAAWCRGSFTIWGRQPLCPLAELGCRGERCCSTMFSKSSTGCDIECAVNVL